MTSLGIEPSGLKVLMSSQSPWWHLQHIQRQLRPGLSFYLKAKSICPTMLLWQKLLLFVPSYLGFSNLSPSRFSPAVQCSGGQVYQECGRACRAACSDLQQGWSCDGGGGGEMGFRMCVPGCQCPPGLVQDHRGQCVPIAMCPCMQGDKMYSPGAVVQNNCNTWYVVG